MLGDRREAFYNTLLETAGPRYANYDPLSLRVGLDLVFTCDILQQLVSANFSQQGLSRSTYNILVLLRNGPADGMQLHELGELLLVSRANVTGLIDHLEQRGLVTRTVDASDRRVRFARITVTGEQLVDDVVPQHYQTVRILLQGMSTDEKQELVKLLKKTRESLVAAPQASGPSEHCKNKNEERL